ncbi:MAG: M6 family metalloprotease domain-containing protein [Hallerella sp.]|jgi:M6 family metalloprotease-like protein|nr:M6 family metalloprotease domain-containing protein [Hallerella sp.]
MQRKIFSFCLPFLLIPSFLFADIVWQGKRVEAWPDNARPTFNSTRNVLRKAYNVQINSPYAKPKGKIYSLTLLVDFSDVPAPVSIDDVKDWLNKEGFNKDGCNGSVRDYYLDVSNGQLDLTNEVFGWYRAKYPKSWYESADRFEGDNKYKASEILMQEVFEYFDSQVDFSRYDNDKDGSTEAINIVYAGSGQTWGQGLWPHSGWSGNIIKDGVALGHHQMTDMPGKFSIYVFVHESGHMIFGWPDLYWYGDYCTMGNRANDLNPVAINDFYRADQGWIPFVDITPDDAGLETTKPGEVCYRYKNPARPDKEGFVWSYVRNTGRDKVLKGSGLLMQHYDFSIKGNSDADKLGLRIVHANSQGKSSDAVTDQWPNPGSEALAFFNSETYSEFSDAKYPAIRWYDGSATGLKITNIGTPGETISFCLGEDCSSTITEPEMQTIAFQVNLPENNNYTPVTVDLNGSDIANFLGLEPSDIESQVTFYGEEPNGTLNSRTTGENTGHWFDANGNITDWNPNGTSIVFSNVDLSTMTTKIGHMPYKVSAGETYVIKQALVYGNKQVSLEFTVTIDGKESVVSKFKKSKRGNPGSPIFNVLGKPVGVRNANGTLPDLPKGSYVEIAK